eukprot:scaffold529879_cov15-Prasinocladus_malaysianus.AAC.1
MYEVSENNFSIISIIIDPKQCKDTFTAAGAAGGTTSDIQDLRPFKQLQISIFATCCLSEMFGQRFEFNTLRRGC